MSDHPYTDPGDGRTQCDVCGKWVWLVTHSCKGVRVAPAADRDDGATIDPAVIEQTAEAIADALGDRQKMQLETCPNGCGCQRMTEDPDRRDCACDGPCCMDPDWWDGFTDAEVLAKAAAAVLVPATAEQIAAKAENLANATVNGSAKGAYFLIARIARRFAAGLSAGAAIDEEATGE